MPPPNFWTSACAREALVMPSIVSSNGSTKQADSVPWAVPAFMIVGELGRKSKPAIRR